MIGGKLSLIYVAIMDITNWSFRSPIIWVEGVNGDRCFSYKFHLIIVHDNLVQDPSNNISIYLEIFESWHSTSGYFGWSGQTSGTILPHRYNSYSGYASFQQTGQLYMGGRDIGLLITLVPKVFFIRWYNNFVYF